nr:uncharacterized protein LOC129269911 [Lytechinus pictus]
MDRPRRTGLSRQSSTSSSPTKQTASRSDDWLNEAVGLSGSKQKPEEKKQIPKADSLKQHGEVGRPSLQIDNVQSTGNEKDKKIGLEGGKDGSKRSGSAADYLGLGGDEIDVDSIAQPKQLTPRGERLSKQESGDNLFGKPANRDAT